MIEKFISNTSNTYIDVLKNTQKTNNKNRYYTFDIDCATLNDYNNIDIRESVEFKKVFTKLSSMKGPVLYWFEILNDIDNKSIREAIQKYSVRKDSKTTPALKTNFNNESKVLYVGKVKRTFWGRIIQHMGFYKVKRTQGLQLFQWGKELNLKVRVHSYEFDNEMSNMISIFEIKLAKQLEPIVGKH